MWLSEIFEREFGFSDVQSNYSRVYAWMANQLGHMTLGLATVLFFVWIVETTETFGVDWLGHGGWLAALAAGWAAGWVPFLNFLLLNAAMLTMGLAAFVVVYRGMKRNALADEKWRRDADALLARHYAVSPIIWRCVMGLTAFGAAALIGLNVPEASATLFTGDAAADKALAAALAERVAPVAAAVATALFGLAVATLCKDWRFAVMGGLAVFGTWWVATNGGGFEGEARKYWGYGALLLFLIVSCLLVVVFARRGERMGRGEALLQMVINLFMASLFVIADNWITTQEWRLALAGLIGALTIWWTKEFASDLPNVHQEIVDVDRKRQGDVLGDVSRVQADYFCDARFDARTDGLFYLAGAWIGAGVASPLAVLVEGSWASGSEILGFLVFLLVFLTLGRNWAYRQLALDRMGAMKASRLGVFYGALRIKSLEGTKAGDMEPMRNATVVANPLTALSAYADDVSIRSAASSDAERTAEEALNGCDHLIIFGAPGSGRSPLGRAIASEAALSDFPTRFREAKRPRAAKGAERTARYITAQRLVTYLDDIREISQASETPTLGISFADKKRLKDGKLLSGEAPPSGAKIKTEAPASLVVIDDVALTSLLDDELDGYLAQLQPGETAPGGVQKTVWLVTIEDAGDGDDADWEAVLASAAEAATRLISILARKSRGDDAVRVGVGLTRRVARYGDMA